MKNDEGLKSLDQMYKASVRPHLDYCDVIYHLPPLLHQAPLGVSLNHLMEIVERVQYQAAFAITGAWNGSTRTKLYEDWDGNHYLIVAGVGVFYRFIKSITTKHHLT